MNTGAIEVLVEELTVLNEAQTPPFTIEDQTDGGEELRMQYRYLDIRRNPVKEKLIPFSSIDGRSQLFDRCRLYRCGNPLFNQIDT